MDRRRQVGLPEPFGSAGAGVYADARRLEPPVTETVQMTDSMSAQQRFAAVVDVLRQAMESIAEDQYYTPRLSWAPRSWLTYWRDRWADRFAPHRSCRTMRLKAAKALDEVAELTGQPWRGLTRITPVRPATSPYQSQSRGVRRFWKR